MNKKTIFSQISTKPSPNSLKWAGKEYSLLSNILLWGLWICRVFSLLQISKLIYRKVVKWLKTGTTDKNSTRINVPPMFCELYFVAWFVFLLSAYLMGWSHPVIIGFTYYFLFESVVWVLYYTIFRRFFEENYSIYHELEYLTVLILLIPTQALGFANLYGDTFQNMLTGILGAGGDATPFPVQILGALFAAIVISMIISAFPAEAVKKQSKKQQIFIIGCGDVVKNRVYPAVKAGGSEEKDIHVYDIETGGEHLPYCKYLENEEAIIRSLQNEVKKDSVVWIETPSYAHISYLNKLISSHCGLLVLEKPITCNKEELLFVEQLIKDDEKRNKIFFLSYYILEKALPLFYLTEPREGYEKYLNIEDKAFAGSGKLMLGALQSAEVVIHEGADSRDWVFEKENGGQKLETFLHNVLIASLFCGSPERWCDVDYKEIRHKDGSHEISLTANRRQAHICLSQKKNTAEGERKRRAEFVFAEGTITADLDAQTAELYLKQIDRSCRISVKEKYRGRYLVLADLVKRVSEGEYTAAEVDGLKNQIEVLKWLMELE